MEVIFFFSVFLIVYSYAIYPAILYLFHYSRISEGDGSVVSNKIIFPDVAIVIAAYNEEDHIEDRIKNLLCLDYPKDKIKFYIGSDGSDDKTNEIVDGFEDESIVFLPFEERRGKASVLNDLVSRAEGEIIVLSDANTDFKVDAVKLLVEGFSDNEVGGVCGELQILSKESNDNLDSMYWKYERFIKEHEGKMDALLGANGAIYAIRKSLFQAIPSDTITDDFYIGMMIVKQGFRFIYQPEAIAFEYEPDDHSDEFKRRVRIGMGNYQAFSRLKSFLNPFGNCRYFFTYISHKVLRWFTPHLMVLIFLISILLMHKPLFIFVLLLQLIVYAFCWYAYKNISIKSLPRVFSLMVFFVSMNAALLLGSIKFITQKANPAWQRTAR
jgi:cellulose synthase/poly-beta-1,6-N-acetylglucosamine synthase-like glycosyltransferase